MQILGLSESTPKTENRFKTLFWPRIRYAEDVELLSVQGYWICFVLTAYTVVVTLVQHVGPAGLLDALFYYLSAVGIRLVSRFAALSVLVIYLLSVVVAIKITHNGGITSIFFLGVLLSNVRATWLASRFVTNNGQTLDSSTEPRARSLFSDVLPRLIWPFGRWLYYGLSVLMLVGIISLLLR